MINHYYSNKYKKDYVARFGEIELGYDIHHIDIDRKNNNIENLVAIPRILHKKYHQNEKQMIICFRVNNITGFKYHRDMLIECYNEIIKYKKTLD